MPARNTLEQLLAVYTNPESHNAQRHRQTNGRTDGQTDRQTDNRMMPVADHTVQHECPSEKSHVSYHIVFITEIRNYLWQKPDIIIIIIIIEELL